MKDENQRTKSLECLRGLFYGATHSMREAISLSLNIVCRDTDATAGTFWVYSKYGTGMISPQARFGGASIDHMQLALGEGIAGTVIATGRPMIVLRTDMDPRWAKRVDLESGFQTKSILCAPLQQDGICFGCIQLINKNEGVFDRDDLEFLQTLCDAISRDFIGLNILTDGKDIPAAAVVFADVRDFTVKAHDMSPMQVAEMSNHFISYISRIVRECGGITNKYIGDSVLAYWTEPDAAYKACLACLLALRDAEFMREGVRNRFNFEMNFGFGVDYGPLFVGNAGTSILYDNTIFGDVVNNASHISSYSPVNKALISEKVLEQLPGAQVELYNPPPHRKRVFGNVYDLYRLPDRQDIIVRPTEQQAQLHA